MVNRMSSLGEVVSLREAMDRLLADSFVGGPFRTMWSSEGSGGTATPRMPLPLDVYATEDEVVLIAAAPGLAAEALQITIDRGTVTLTGEIPNAARSEEAQGATWYVHELPYGRFQRSVTLPIEVDGAKADATFEHGVLRLRLPKAEQARPRQIKVRTVEQGSAATPEAIGAASGDGASADNGQAG